MREQLYEIIEKLDDECDKTVLRKVIFVLDNMITEDTIDAIKAEYEDEIEAIIKQHEERYDAYVKHQEEMMQMYKNAAVAMATIAEGSGENLIETLSASVDETDTESTMEGVKEISDLLSKGAEFKRIIEAVNTNPVALKDWNRFLTIWKLSNHD